MALLILALPTAAWAQVDTGDISLHTPFPGVVAEAGDTLDFDVTVTTDQPLIADIAVEGVPDGWETSVTGGGTLLERVAVTPDAPQEFTVSITLPADTPEGVYEPTLIAEASGSISRLPLRIRVEAGASGQLTVEPNLPGQRATAGDTVDFDLTIHNSTPVDAELELSIDGPQGWRLDIKPQQDAQATEFVVGSNSTATVDVTAVAPQSTPEGEYLVTARVANVDGGWDAEVPLLVAITGSYGMTFTTTAERLNTEVTIGSSSTLDLVVANTGTAALHDVSLSTRAPSNWTVEFDTPTVTTIEPGATAVVVATITPSEEAIAGDYVIDFTASHPEVENATLQIRTSVSPSPIWGWVGIGLIVATFIILLVVFRRFGRR